MKNQYRQGFEQERGIPVGKTGDGWIRVFMLDVMIATPGCGYTRRDVVEIIMTELKKRGDERKEIDRKTAGKILEEIRIGLLNSKVFSIRCSRDMRAGKTKSFQYTLRVIH